MDLSLLSNHELATTVENLCAGERKTTLEFLYYLIEIDSRRLYVDLGYSSLFDFCVRKLKYSEGGAGRRVAAARCLKEFPELSEMIVSGKVSLCGLSAAAASIREKKISCEDIVDCSAREVRALLAPLSPVERKPAERVRPIVVKREASPIPQEERYEIRFSVTKEVYEEIKEATNRLSNSLGGTPSVEALFKKLLSHYLKDKKPRASKPSVSSRHIPAALKREVLKRDKGQCSYCAPDGTRCESKRFLEIDHVLPVALGGKSEPENLRLLCHAHNQLAARRIFGSDHMRQYDRR